MGIATLNPSYFAAARVGTFFTASGRLLAVNNHAMCPRGSRRSFVYLTPVPHPDYPDNQFTILDFAHQPVIADAVASVGWVERSDTHHFVQIAR